MLRRSSGARSIVSKLASPTVLRRKAWHLCGRRCSEFAAAWQEASALPPLCADPGNTPDRTPRGQFDASISQLQRIRIIGSFHQSLV
jgi:hypothetical protein